MKLGTRSLLALLAGAVSTFFLPADNEIVESTFAIATAIVIQLGRYFVYPLFFFNMAVAVGILKRGNRLGSVTFKIVLAIVGSTFLMTLLGAFVALVAPLSRIPIAFEQDTTAVLPLNLAFLESILPTNAFSIFGSSVFLPLAVMALILGANFAYDREIAEPTYNLFDSLGRIFYRLTSYYVKFSAIPIFIFAFNFFYQFRVVGKFELFTSMIILTIVSVVVIGLALYSFIYWFLCGKKQAFSWLRGVTPFPLFALLSSDRMLTYAFSSVVCHENQGIKRDFGSYAIPLFALFGRAGTAFINAMAMIIILKSYNSLDITFLQVSMAIFFSFIASLMVTSSSGSLLMTLSLTCLLYGNNLSSGSLILKPALPLLNQIGQSLDAFTLLLAIKIISYYEGFEKHKMRSNFI